MGVASRQGQPLDPLDFLGVQVEIEDIEVVPHVAGVGGPGQGHHAHVEGEPEDDLGDGPVAVSCDAGQLGTGQRLAVGGQQREALVDQPVGGAERADVAVPSPGGVAPVLDEAGPDPRLPAEAVELFERDVADPSRRARPLSWMASIARQASRSAGARPDRPVGPCST
jgi:hypothetical protein